MANDTQQLLTHIDETFNVVSDGNMQSRAPRLFLHPYWFPLDCIGVEMPWLAFISFLIFQELPTG